MTVACLTAIRVRYLVIIMTFLFLLLLLFLLVFWTVAYTVAIGLGWPVVLILVIVGCWWLCVVRPVGWGSIHSNIHIEYRWRCNVNYIPCVAVLFLQFRIRRGGVETIYK